MVDVRREGGTGKAIVATPYFESVSAEEFAYVISHLQGAATRHPSLSMVVRYESESDCFHCGNHSMDVLNFNSSRGDLILKINCNQCCVASNRKSES